MVSDFGATEHIILPLTISNNTNENLSLNDNTRLTIGTICTVAILCILTGAMIVATLVGNSLVILAVLLVRKLKTHPANYLLVSLAVADFCVGLLVMPTALVDLLTEEWILGEAVCDLLNLFD